jgi:hypothetical protein
MKVAFGAFFARLKRFLAKPHALLTVLGALVIFITYSVKEVWRDDLKQEVDAIDVATNAVSIHQDNARLTRQLDELRYAQQNNLPNVKNYDSRYRLYYFQLELPIQMLRGELHYCDEYIAIVPPLNEKYHDRLAELRRRVNDAYVDTKRKFDALAVLPTSKAFAVDALGNFSIFGLDDEIAELQYELTQEAEHYKQQDTSKFQLANKISYVLYGFGWAIGLIGRLLENSAGDETE